MEFFSAYSTFWLIAHLYRWHANPTPCVSGPFCILRFLCTYFVVVIQWNLNVMSYWYLKLINSEFVLHSSLIVLHICLHRVPYERKWLLSRAVNFNYYLKKISMQYIPLPPSRLNSCGHSPMNLMLYFLQLNFSLYHCSVLICHHGLRCVIDLTRYNILHL